MEQVFTHEDAKQPPRWEFGTGGCLFIAKGKYCVVALLPGSGISEGAIDIWSQGEVVGWRTTSEAAVEAAEALHARWFPADPKPTKPRTEAEVGKKTAAGKVVSSNPFAAPI